MRSPLCLISPARRAPTSSSSSIPTIPRAGSSLQRRTCVPSKLACWSSTKPSSTFCHPRRALPAICRPTPSSCDPSARPMDWPACAWASRSRKRPSPLVCATNSGPGPCRALPSRSARWRWATMRGCRRRHGATADAKRLDALLVAAGFTILGGTPLFRLASHSKARLLVERLGQQGIHVRAFADQQTWLRFGVPADEEGFRRLAAALQVPQKV